MPLMSLSQLILINSAFLLNFIFFFLSFSVPSLFTLFEFFSSDLIARKNFIWTKTKFLFCIMKLSSISKKLAMYFHCIRAEVKYIFTLVCKEMILRFWFYFLKYLGNLLNQNRKRNSWKYFLLTNVSIS